MIVTKIVDKISTSLNNICKQILPEELRKECPSTSPSYNHSLFGSPSHGRDSINTCSVINEDYMSYSLISLVDLSAMLSSGYFSIHHKVLKRRHSVLTTYCSLLCPQGLAQHMVLKQSSSL